MRRKKYEVQINLENVFKKIPEQWMEILADG